LICVVKGKGEQTELQTQAAGSARICVSIDGVEQVLPAKDWTRAGCRKRFLHGSPYLRTDSHDFLAPLFRRISRVTSGLSA
jgi:hypothetical protein